MSDLRQRLIDAGADAWFSHEEGDSISTSRGSEYKGLREVSEVILDAFLDVLEAVRPTSTHTIALLAVARGPRVADPIGEES